MYTLSKLNVSFQDLEPYIDTHTMALHYNKHMKGYLNKLNSLLVKNKYNFQYPLEQLYFYLNLFPHEDREDILFNLGGVLNHELYFNCLSKNELLPQENLEKQIIRQYGSIQKFIKEFKETAMKLKGSGYTFLEILVNGQLAIINRANQDNPIFHGNIPLFCIDLWEHAYYINYENNKDTYLENIFNITSFSYANKIYEDFLSKISLKYI